MARTRFSIGEALGAPFRLAAQRPVTVFVWGLLNTAPFLIVLPMMGDLSSMAWTGAAAETGFDPDMMATFWKWQALSSLANLAQLLLWAVITASVIRTVIAPGAARRRPFALGLGMDELRVAVIKLLVVIGVMAVMLVTMMIAGALLAAVWSQGIGARALVIGLGVAACMLTTLVAYARLSLIAPASVALGDFAFEQGWTLARGQTGRLVLMVILLWIIGVVIMLAAYLAAGLIAWGAWVGLGLTAPETPEAVWPLVKSQPVLWGVGGVLILLMTWVIGFAMALMGAPYASAAKQLLATPETSLHSNDTSDS